MWPNPPETTDLVTFTQEVLNGKLHFLCSGTRIARPASWLKRFPAELDFNNGNIPCAESSTWWRINKKSKKLLRRNKFR